MRGSFDWPVVIGQYRELFDELGAIRAAAPAESPRKLHPLRGDPFRDFSHFATSQLQPTTLVAAANVTAQSSDLHRFLLSRSGLDLMYAGCHASPAELQQLLLRLDQDGPLSVGDLLATHQPSRHQALAMGLVWMAKLGALRWFNPDN